MHVDVIDALTIVREESTLRDASQKTKTEVVEPVGSVVPVAEGDTRVPRIVAPATTSADTIES